MSESAVVADLLKAWGFLYRRGYIEGFGHISARLPGTDRFLLARHSMGPRATAEEFVLMDADGRKLEGRGDAPGEAPIHTEIYRARPDVGSIFHYHGMHSTAFTTSEHALRPIHLLGTIFHAGLPVYPDPRLVSDAARGKALALSLGGHRAVLMRAHGAAVTGASVAETVAGAFLLEENAHRAWVAASMGKPLWLDETTAASAGEELISSRGPFRRVWALVEAESDQ